MKSGQSLNPAVHLLRAHTGTGENGVGIAVFRPQSGVNHTIIALYSDCFAVNLLGFYGLVFVVIAADVLIPRALAEGDLRLAIVSIAENHLGNVVFDGGNVLFSKAVQRFRDGKGEAGKLPRLLQAIACLPGVGNLNIFRLRIQRRAPDRWERENVAGK